DGTAAVRRGLQWAGLPAGGRVGRVDVGRVRVVGPLRVGAVGRLRVCAVGRVRAGTVGTLGARIGGRLCSRTVGTPRISGGGVLLRGLAARHVHRDRKSVV